jgi:hypothetical protein
MSKQLSNAGNHGSLWSKVMSWFKACEAALPVVWPAELPPEETPGFWFLACKEEMRTRKEISGKLRTMIETGDTGTVTPLEAWLIRRRLEWAGQYVLAAVMKKIEPDQPIAETLYWALVEAWEESGCISMWNHAERDGKPHPANPDGLSPIDRA